MLFPTLAIALALAPAKPNMTLVFAGDIMLNQIAPKSKPLAAIAPLLKTGTLTFANLEIPLTDAKQGTPYKLPKELKAKTQFILKADPAFAQDIADSGVDLVSLGNNHAMDYRAAGLEQMMDLLTKKGILYTGAGPTYSEAREMTSKDGVGLVSALAFMGTAAIRKLTPAQEDRPGIHALIFNGQIDAKTTAYLHDWIAGQRQGQQIVVVALHWGIERQTVPTSYQVKLAHACIDAGADVVWGHHPHVLQGAELYKGKPILYSMGNLISRSPAKAGLVRMYFESGKMTKFRFLPCEISGGKVRPTPEKAETKRVEEFKKLSLAIAKKYKSKDSKPLY